jgi:hypothetical protein
MIFTDRLTGPIGKVRGLGFDEVLRAYKTRLAGAGGLTEIIFLNIMEKEICERQIYGSPFRRRLQVIFILIEYLFLFSLTLIKIKTKKIFILFNLIYM